MAEIQRVETRVQSCNTLAGGVGGVGLPRETIEINTIVRSIHGSDASVVNDFAAALDAAQAPGTAQIEARRSATGHFTGLTARWTTTVEQPKEGE